MTFTYKVRVYGYIEGYNPPNLYKRITSKPDAVAFLDYVDVGEEIAEYDCKHSCDNNRGEIILRYGDYNFRTSVVNVIEYDGDNMNRVITGTVDTVELISSSEMRITYTIDHYTSSVLTYYITSYEYQLLPTAYTLLCKRASDGERTYLADGISPVNVTLGFHPFSFTYNNSTEQLFLNNATSNNTKKIMAYNDTSTNCLVWLIGANYYTPSYMWTRFKVAFGLKGASDFDPLGVLFYGETNVNWNILHTMSGSVLSDEIRSLSDLTFNDEEGDKNLGNARDFNSPVTGVVYEPYNGNSITPSERERFVIRDCDGAIAFEYQMGVTYPSPYTTVGGVFNYDISSPSISIPVNEVYTIKGNTNFMTIPCQVRTFVVDNEQVYNAEERVYQQQSRQQQTMDNLVSGITGSVTTGVTMYGFSRGLGADDGGRTPRKSLNQGTAGFKGALGGGVALAGTLATFAYDELYANDKKQSIEDEHQKLKADSLLTSSTVSSYMYNFTGLYTISYDTDTDRDVVHYHRRYGYQTSRVDTDKELNTYKGYIQGELVMKPGFNKTVETYICKMFRNGVYFS